MPAPRSPDSNDAPGGAYPDRLARPVRSASPLPRREPGATDVSVFALPGVDHDETRRLYRRTLRLLDAALREAGRGAAMTEPWRAGDATFLIVLGATIQTERTERGLSQHELAHRAGLAPAIVHSIERGERAFGVLALRALADALGVPLPTLLEAADTAGRSVDHDPPPASS